MEASKVLQEFQTLKAEKQEGTNLIVTVNEFFSPTDRAVVGDETIKDVESYVRKGELLDTTCSDIIDEYVTNVLGLYFNTEMAWFKTSLPSLKVSDHDTRVLALRDDLLYKLISKSNYYSVCPQHEWDVLVHGHGLMTIDKDADDFAVCYTEEPANLYFRQSYKRKIIEMYWERRVELSALLDMYKDVPGVQKAVEKEESNRNFKLIHSVVPNNERYTMGLSDEMKKKVRGKGENLFRVVTDDVFTGDRQNSSTGAFDILVEAVDIDRFVGARNLPSRQNAYGDSMGKKLLIKSRVLNKLTRDGLLTSRTSSRPS